MISQFIISFIVSGRHLFNSLTHSPDYTKKASITNPKRGSSSCQGLEGSLPTVDDLAEGQGLHGCCAYRVTTSGSSFLVTCHVTFVSALELLLRWLFLFLLSFLCVHQGGKSGQARNPTKTWIENGGQVRGAGENTWHLYFCLRSAPWKSGAQFPCNLLHFTREVHRLHAAFFTALPRGSLWCLLS